MRVGVKRQASEALHPGKIRYPLYRSLDGPLDRSGRVRKISLTPRFNPRTFHAVASRYIDHALPVHRTTVKSKSVYAKVGPKKCSEQSGQADMQSGAVLPTAGQWHSPHKLYVTKACVNTVDAEDGAVVVVETRAVKVIVTHPVLYTSLVFVNTYLLTYLLHGAESFLRS